MTVKHEEQSQKRLLCPRDTSLNDIMTRWSKRRLLRHFIRRHLGKRRSKM